MAICESCGLKYKPTPESPECPNCSPPQRAARPATSASGAPQSARPAASPARPAAAGAPRPATAGAPRPVAAAAPRAAAPTRAPARAAAPPPPPAKHHTPHHYVHDPNAPSHMHFDKATKIGFGLCGGLIVLTLIVVFSISSKKKTEREADAKAKAALDSFMVQLREFDDAHNEDAAAKGLKLATDQAGIWKNSEMESEAMRLQTRLQSTIDNSRERHSVEERFKEIEAALASPEKLSPETMRDLKVKLDEVEARANIGGGEFEKKVAATKVTLTHTTAQRLLADAQAAAAANPDNPRIAMRKSIAAEDQVYPLFNEAARNKSPEAEFFKPIYTELVGLTDKLATETFGQGDGAQESKVMTDLLAGDPKTLGWNPTNVKGFSWQISNGTLQIIGPDPGVNQQAILAIGDREQWRYFVFDMKFTIEKGWFEMYAHLGKSINANTPVYRFSSEGEQATFDAGKSYSVRGSILGNKFVIRLTGDDTSAVHEEELSWTRTRKGAIGFLIPPGTKLTIQEFKLRELN